MKRIIITVAAALLAVVPATIGLVGNTSFAQSVPVRVPSQATVVDDNGGQGTHVEPGDDKGGLTTTTQPGDDNRGQGATSSGSNEVSTSGSAKGDNGGHGGKSTGSSGKVDGPGHS